MVLEEGRARQGLGALQHHQGGLLEARQTGGLQVVQRGDAAGGQIDAAVALLGGALHLAHQVRVGEGAHAHHHHAQAGAQHGGRVLPGGGRRGALHHHVQAPVGQVQGLGGVVAAVGRRQLPQLRLRGGDVGDDAKRELPELLPAQVAHDELADVAAADDAQFQQRTSMPENCRRDA